eukprot:4495794-Amphidinium_carterae.1
MQRAASEESEKTLAAKPEPASTLYSLQGTRRRILQTRQCRLRLHPIVLIIPHLQQRCPGHHGTHRPRVHRFCE